MFVIFTFEKYGPGPKVLTQSIPKLISRFDPANEVVSVAAISRLGLTLEAVEMWIEQVNEDLLTEPFILPRRERVMMAMLFKTTDQPLTFVLSRRIRRWQTW